MIQDLIWAWRVRRLWKQAKKNAPDYPFSEFLGLVGHGIACGKLPKNALNRLNIKIVERM